MTQRFLVKAPRIPLKWIAVVMFVVVVTYVSAMLAVHIGRSYAAARNPSSYITCVAAIFVGIVLAVGFWPRKIAVDVAYDRLTVNEYHTAVFPLASAQLGMWMTPYYGTVQGTALHLHEGSKSYIIGGQDHRVESEWHLDAPVVQSANAYMPAAQFAALLAAVFGDRLAAAVDRGQHAVCRCLLVERHQVSDVAPQRATDRGNRNRRPRSPCDRRPNAPAHSDGATVSGDRHARQAHLPWAPHLHHAAFSRAASGCANNKHRHS